MEPVDFAEATRTLLKPSGMTDEECGLLRVWTDGQMCVSLWRPSWRERLSALLFGRVWLFVMSGQTQPPVAIEATRTVFVYRTLLKDAAEDGFAD